MKLEKAAETLLVFIAALIIIVTAYFAERVGVANNVSSEYIADISLTGTRLSEEVYATMTRSGTWEIVGGYGSQYDFVLYNDGALDISNWKMFLEIPEGASLEGCWNAAATQQGRTVTLSPEFYNISLKAKDNVSFGLILNTKEMFYPTEITFMGYKTAMSGGSIFRKLIYLAFVIWVILFTGFFVTRFNLKNYRERQKNDVRVILQSMNTFISFIDAKDPYTRGHSRRVAMYAAELAKRMRLSEDEIQNIYYAGLLHDAGKISVPDAVLNKPGKLTDEERKLIQNHTVAGGKMLKQLSSLRGIRETALYHHERYDGKGYPEGLRGEEIPLYARIVGVADSYDAMSSSRVYRRHLNKDEIIDEIQKGSGTQFDPNIVPYMVDMINDGYVNVVKMETVESDDSSTGFHLTEDDIPGVYMGF
ncbi:MAG: HD domain-containing protein [Butyrivibrio sp.]|nr:HD domain-containing protein [Butyrivibrio sp.]